MYKKIFGVIILLFNIVLCNDVITVTAVGEAETKRVALNTAKRNAIEEGLGTIVSSATLSNNYLLISDKIYTKADGFVKSFEILDEEKTNAGTIKITIKAEVTKILDELTKDMAILGMLLDWVRHPRIMVLINENDIDDKQNLIVETELGKLLGKKGFDIVSRRQINVNKELKQKVALAENDPVKAAEIGAEMGAELLVLGQALTTIKPSRFSKTRMVGQSNITAQIIKTDNAEIISQNTLHGKANHVDGITAGVKAIKDASKDLVDYLIKQIIVKWSTEQTKGISIGITVNKVAYRDKQKLMSYFEKVDGVTEVILRSYKSKKLKLTLKYTGDKDDLGGKVDGQKVNDKELMIVSETPNSFEINLGK